MCVNKLSKVALDSAAAAIESATSSRKSNALTTAPPSHHIGRAISKFNNNNNNNNNNNKHWQLHICRLLLSLPAPQQTSLPVVKKRNIRASPIRTFFSQSQWNPTVRSVPVLCPSSPLWANA